MWYVAEITLRTVPFEAETKDDALARAWSRAAFHWFDDNKMQPLEVTVTELEDTD